jgi:hypothetical protein
VKFREAVKALAEQEGVPSYQFRHKQRKDDLANCFRRRRNVRDAIVCIGVAQKKAQTFNDKKVNQAIPVRPRQGGLRQSLLLLHR